MKKIVKAFIVAFSMYSKIPMPHFNWASEDMEYHLCFFPFVGLVIGALEYLWYYLASRFMLPELLVISFAIALPFIVTGGFHMDGFLDTMDALHSYGDKEKKLSILKDPHVGAFAIISLAVYLLLALGFGAVIVGKGKLPFLSLCFTFVISRCLSGISVTCFSKAKKDGMVAVESESSNKKIVFITLLIELVISAFCLLWINQFTSFCGVVVLAAMGLSFLYYYLMSKKQFGGINGDLAGFFVCISELCALIGVSVCLLFGV